MKSESLHIPPHVLRAAWIALFLLAFALRTFALTRVPPGLTHDEASNGHDAAAILRGVHRLYFPVGYGHEPLYNYSVAAMTCLLGEGIFTLRLTTVIWSMVTWTLTFTLARRWWGHRAALMGGAAMAVGFWPLMMARVGLRGPTLPALIAASALAYDRALTAPSRRRAAWGYVAAGLWLGASFYTYMASRGMPLLYVAFLALLALTDRATLRRAWWGTVGLLIVAALVGLPLFLYLRAHPSLEQRIAQLGGALDALRHGDWRPLWENIVASLPMLLWQADPRWLYNLGGRAALEPFTAVAFLTGVTAALIHLRDRRSGFLLLWLGSGLAPAFLAPVEYNTLHAIAAMPAVYLLVAVGLEHIRRLLHRLTPPLAALVVGIGLAWTGLDAAHAYFATWANHRDVRVAYHHHLVALGRALRAAPPEEEVLISTIYPGGFHDPYTMEVTLGGRPFPLRWMDGRRALFFPLRSSDLYTHTLAPLHAALTPWWQPYAAPLPTLRFRSDDLIPAIYGYTWEAPAAWRALTASLQRQVRAAPGDLPPSPTDLAFTTPITFGELLSLTGYALFPPETPDGPLIVLTAWEVHAPTAREWVLFTHALNAEGELVAQEDRLDAPSWQWQAGDRFVQLHQLPRPQEPYTLTVGLYDRATLRRLPLAVLPNATRVVLATIDLSQAVGYNALSYRFTKENPTRHLTSTSISVWGEYD